MATRGRKRPAARGRVAGHDDGETRIIVLATGLHPELLAHVHPLMREGAGQAGYRLIPMARVRQKRARGITTDQPIIRPSLHNGFMSRSPWGPGFFAPIAARIVSAQPSASVSAPGPHDFAVRKDAARRAPNALGTLRPPHPASRVVTIAIRPSCRSEQAHKTSDLQNP
jgi:hypothetical protein